MTNDKRTAQYKHNLESVCVCVLQLIATYNVWQIEIVCIDQFVAVLFLNSDITTRECFIPVRGTKSFDDCLTFN